MNTLRQLLKAALARLPGLLNSRRPILRAAREEDLDDIDRIQACSPGAAHWQPAQYLAYDCRVAEVKGRVRGFLVLQLAVEQEWEILNLAVHPEFRHRGVGTSLLREALKCCPGHVYLEVRESNRTAQRLYRKLGFRQIAIRLDYYENPKESAVVMRL